MYKSKSQLNSSNTDAVTAAIKKDKQQQPQKVTTSPIQALEDSSYSNSGFDNDSAPMKSAAGKPQSTVSKPRDGQKKPATAQGSDDYSDDGDDYSEAVSNNLPLDSLPNEKKPEVKK